MKRNLHAALVAAVLPALLLAAWLAPVAAAEKPYGKGMTEANQERLLLDDMQDVSDWYNGSPAETTLSSTDRHVKQGHRALLFANRVDYTKGEKSYPVGWPRTGKDLAKAKLTDWSGYDRFECWIYTETSRESLPKTPLGVGFYHGGHKQSSGFPLTEVKKDAWVKVVIPVARLADPKDVWRIQFHISEADYRHGDRVDFFIDAPALVRYVEPAVAELEPERRVVFSSERTVRARYKVAGYKGLDRTKVELSIGRGEGPPAAKASGRASRDGELAAPIARPLAPGTYWARLDLRDAEGKLIDRKQAEFRVVAGPF